MGVFKHLDIDALPEGWDAAHFRDLTDYALGRTPPRNDASYWKDGTYPWVSISDMEPFGVVTDTAEQVTEKAFEQVFRGQLVPEGSLLMSFKLTIGRIARLGIPALHNEAIISFVPVREKVDDRYLAYYLSQINYSDYQDKAIKGHTLNKGKIDALEIALPPLPEQQRIAQVLSTVQEAIAQQERLIRTTTELKQALMQKLFTEGLRGEKQKETEIGRVPESWEVVELSDVFKFTSGKPKPIDTTLTRSDERPIPVYGGNGIMGYTTERLLDQTTLILGRVGEYCGCAHLTEPMAWITDNALYVKEDKLKPNYEYLREHLDYLDLNQYSNKMGQPLITQGIIGKVKFGLPTRKEQDEIATALKAVEDRIHVAEHKRNALQDLFRTLLHELMTGKVRVGEEVMDYTPVHT